MTIESHTYPVYWELSSSMVGIQNKGTTCRYEDCSFLHERMVIIHWNWGYAIFRQTHIIYTKPKSDYPNIMPIYFQIYSDKPIYFRCFQIIQTKPKSDTGCPKMPWCILIAIGGPPHQQTYPLSPWLNNSHFFSPLCLI